MFSKKIKILYGLEAADGGSLKHLTYLTENINKEIFEITVILSTHRSPKVFAEIRKMENAGVTVIIISMQRRVHLLRDFKSLIKIIAHLRMNDYDIIHSHSSKAGVLFRIAAKIKGIHCNVYTPHCFYFQSKTGISKFIYSWLEKLMSYITTYIIVSNNEKVCAINNNITTNKKLVNINNAIKFDEYDDIDERSRIKSDFGIDENCFVIGGIGRLTSQKDWLTFLYSAEETVKDISNVVFLIVGDGELFENLRDFVEKRGLKKSIIFLGHSFQINNIYTIIDIFVSTSKWEGLPYVILEAMWFKKPIIATNLDYYDILLDKQNGYLVPIKDYKLIAKKIKNLILDKDLLTKMGERSHQLIQANFSFKDFIKKHEDLYISLKNHYQ